jgi:hypothetical protein
MGGDSQAGGAGDGDYNIWYHKRAGTRRDPKAQAEHCCDLARDAGKTRATTPGQGAASLCLFFAQGRCALGPNCTHAHRAPTAADERALGNGVDIFGRERFGRTRADQGGVGSFGRECRTLYVGGLGSGGGGKDGQGLEALVRANFETWGDLEYCRVKQQGQGGGGCFAFVRYAWRGGAEFAKEAMGNQVLLTGRRRGAEAGAGALGGAGAVAAALKKGSGPQRPAPRSASAAAAAAAGGGGAAVLNIRWATDDPNPKQRRWEQRRNERAILAGQVALGMLPEGTVAAPQRAGEARGGHPPAKRARVAPAQAEQQQQQQQQQAVARAQYLATAVEGLGAPGAYPNTDAQYASVPAAAPAASGAPVAAPPGLAPPPSASASAAAQPKAPAGLAMLAAYGDDSSSEDDG